MWELVCKGRPPKLHAMLEMSRMTLGRGALWSCFFVSFFVFPKNVESPNLSSPMLHLRARQGYGEMGGRARATYFTNASPPMRTLACGRRVNVGLDFPPCYQRHSICPHVSGMGMWIVVCHATNDPGPRHALLQAYQRYAGASVVCNKGNCYIGCHQRPQGHHQESFA